MQNFDHIFVAVHAEAAPALLPYDASLDEDCAWTSQWYFTLLASALFRHHVLMLPSVVVINPSHSNYPKDNCIAHMTNVSAYLRASVPVASQGCFPDAVNGMIVLPDRVAHSSYIPWGSARRKGDGSASVSYSGATLASVSSCDDLPAARALQRPSAADAPWCVGCTDIEAWGSSLSW